MKKIMFILLLAILFIGCQKQGVEIEQPTTKVYIQVQAVDNDGKVTNSNIITVK